MNAATPMARSVEPESAVPVHVQIEVTWKCNWRCLHCYQDDHTQQSLTTERLERLFEELAACGALHIIVTGGEPLVRPDILRLLRSIRRLDLGATLYTNGHKIDPGMAEQLGPLVSVAEVSLLAGDAETHDRLSRVRGSYARTYRAISLLRAQGVHVIVKTPVLRPALPTLKRLQADLNNLGVQWLADVEISRSYAGDLQALAYKLGTVELREFFRSFPEFHPLPGFNMDPGMRTGMCLAGRQFCFIDALGNVYPCLNFKSACDVLQASGEVASANVGNVLHEAFTQIWQRNAFLQEIRAATRSDFPSCGTCAAATACNPCMALNYEEHGEIHMPSSAACLPLTVVSAGGS